MKTPIQRLRELTKILKDDDCIIKYDKLLLNGFIIEALWQPKIKVMFLMKDLKQRGENKVIYLDDNDTGVYEDEILEIVEDLEHML